MKPEGIDRLKELLIQYKNFTSQLIELLEKNDFDNLESVLDLRQNIIIEVNKIDFDASEFKKISDSISILPLQKKLTLLMNEKKSIVKKQINSLEGSKVANKNYSKGFSIDSLYFNKKI